MVVVAIVVNSFIASAQIFRSANYVVSYQNYWPSDLIAFALFAWILSHSSLPRHWSHRFRLRFQPRCPFAAAKDVSWFRKRSYNDRNNIENKNRQPEAWRTIGMFCSIDPSGSLLPNTWEGLSLVTHTRLLHIHLLTIFVCMPLLIHLPFYSILHTCIYSIVNFSNNISSTVCV
jgi:hypothetical protein